MSRLAPSTVRRAVPAVAATILLAACGGDKVAGPGSGGARDAGSFTGAIAGDLARPITGVAYYQLVSGSEPGERGFAVGMGSLRSDSSFKDMIVAVRGRRELPAPGTYTLYNFDGEGEIADDQFAIVGIMDMPGGGGMFCAGTVGTLTVQSASGGHVKGSYNTQASCLDPADAEHPRAVTLSGAFDAIEGTRLTIPSVARGTGDVRLARGRLAAARLVRARAAAR